MSLFWYRFPFTLLFLFPFRFLFPFPFLLLIPAFPDALSVKEKTSEGSSFSRNEIDSSRKMSKIEELAVKKRSTANDSTYRVDAESNINAEEETPGILSDG